MGKKTKEPEPNEYFVASEIARMRGCSERTVRGAILAGRLKALRVRSRQSVIYAVQWKHARKFTARSYTVMGE